jgi:hypothetical protein
MDKNQQKTLLIVAAIICGAVLVLNIGGKFVVDRVADRVIEKLFKEYSPSPYGPGVDPDKTDINIFNRMQQQKRQQQPQPQRTSLGEPYQEGNWQNNWEANRR